MEKFNFVKQERHKLSNRGNYRGGLSVYGNYGNIYISDNNFPKYNKVDVYLDNEKNAIKIVEGNTFSLFSDKYNRYSFSSCSLIKKGLKIGHYKYIGDNIFVLEDNN